ncbi:TadE/TadG family type IV pilus assembly protein [Roseiflexus castenholzii]|uniref:TadE/TadG family type IV pilus assembly protein n=1 Tax=Roseiflexus castenholzii TaxID=120962 RepID=UPI003C7CFE59
MTMIHESRRTLRRTFAHAQGQALIEMAIALSLILMVVIGGLNALQAIGCHYAVGQAVRSAVHVAAVRGSSDGVPMHGEHSLATAPGQVAEAARLTLQGSPFVDVTKARIRVTCASDPCRRFDPITVTIRYEEETWAPFPLLDRIAIQRSATRIAEQDSSRD